MMVVLYISLRLLDLDYEDGFAILLGTIPWFRIMVFVIREKKGLHDHLEMLYFLL